ncbi:MAG: 2-oxoglutarate dehydrogenase complex dihydrolipoyllysine-residue succinyltransferase [Nitrospira sp. LK70]|nr:2-oxoglutarate dehydrogenase complex dihydrolipoyllysine-residue succinyltransferase [Nitrospira sp. LK70]
MSIELKIPTIGESITEVQIDEWLKSPGETVRQDEPIVSLETEKTSLDLPAPVSGVLVKVLKKKGEMAHVGEVIAYLDEATVPKETAAPVASGKTAASAAPSKPPVSTPDPTRVMPSARRLLNEHRLGVEEPTPTGPGGRMLKEDVLRRLEERPSQTEPASAVETDSEEEAAPPRSVPRRLLGSRDEEAVPMSMLRRRVAERLVQAQQTAALLTTFNEIDMTAVTALRQDLQESFQQRYAVKLGLMSFFVKAVIESLKLVSELNAEIRGTEILYRHYYDIAIAIGSGRGLVVPVLRNAERLSFAEIENAIADFARRAQANRLTLEELQGGTFTISNGGVYGSLLSTPIVNPPQSGILGLHVIQDRPVARDGQVVLRPMMYVALTYDHRIVDGREAVTFLKHIKACIEEPARILLEI